MSQEKKGTSFEEMKHNLIKVGCKHGLVIESVDDSGDKTTLKIFKGDSLEDVEKRRSGGNVFSLKR